MSNLKIGMIGLDSSHVVAFAKLLHDTSDPHHVAGARITAAYPGGSPDFALSHTRVPEFTRSLEEQYGVRMVDSIAGLEDKCDSIILSSIDGRIHLEQFRQVMDWGKPVFINKPMATSTAEALEIATMANHKDIRVFTGSIVRYAEAISRALKDDSLGAIVGADVYGPLPLIETLPGYLWYGIHSAEMLYAALGQGCNAVRAYRSGDQDILMALWEGERLATIRGTRTGNYDFGGTIHRKKGSQLIDFSNNAKPYYSSFLGVLIRFLNGEDILDLSESVEIIRFLEAANESMQSNGEWVELQVPASKHHE